MIDEKYWYEELRKVLDKESKLKEQLFFLSEENKKNSNELSVKQKEVEDLKLEVIRLSNALSREQELYSSILSSHSWKITAPFRMFRRLIGKLWSIFLLILKQPHLIIKTFSNLKKYGPIHTWHKIIWKLQGETNTFLEQSIDNVSLDLLRQQNVIILTSKHTYFVAQLFKTNLMKIGKKAKIVFAEELDNNYRDEDLYFVICPNIFNTLPKNYVAFNLEQLISSRWFEEDKNYRKKLENSYALFDYSIKNIEILEDKYDFSYKQIYFMPISYHKELGKSYSDIEESYDVLFYGDDKNPRRQKFLETISKKFKLKIINDSYKDELYQELSKAKIVVNIHYYENALLETTRLYESLSLNRLVISEDAQDSKYYPDLLECVEIVPKDDIEAMVEKIEFYLKNEEARKNKIAKNKQYLRQAPNNFEYFFMRFLLANDWISFDDFYTLASKNVEFKKDIICLTLPETPKRMKEFSKDNSSLNIPFFYGLRHKIGYVGCGLSYKFMAKKALEQNLPYFTICEDDVGFKENFVSEYKEILEYLKNEKNWTVFSGLLAEIKDNAEIKKINGKFIHISDFVSTVFCVYSPEALKCISKYDNRNIKTNNTIDRYIGNSENINTITTYPYLVEQKNEIKSTLWGKQNDVLYSGYFDKSNEDMKRKIQEYQDEIERKN